MVDSMAQLLQELEIVETTHQRRLQIGKQLNEMGDLREGVGVKDGLPDIAWLPMTHGGTVAIWRSTHTEPIAHFEVRPFYIAKYLVTYAQYQAFVDAEDGFENLAWWSGMPKQFQRQKLAEQRTKRANNPRDSVSWYQAIAFTRWLTHRLQGVALPHPSGNGTLSVGESAQVRLPTEWEWQWAAQGGAEKRPFPWGERQEGFANTGESGLEQGTAVGMYPHGAAACGALDMGGNLMEWCASNKVELETIDVASTASKVLRGGDWGYELENAACTYCDDEDPADIDPLNGFRLVLSGD